MIQILLIYPLDHETNSKEHHKLNIFKKNNGFKPQTIDNKIKT